MSAFTLLLLLAFDGGANALDAGLAWLTAEDQEVVDNLELLQQLEQAADLELLEELSIDR